ncbi:MAG: enoyl-ACP reductase [Elusimicrobia bacterium]|nr:enoyl-ACP reductase [Elusimicrobiota bacterium]
MISLKDKTALILGVASERSIAWAIAKKFDSLGANILLGYQFRYHSRIKDLVGQLTNLAGYERCDVTKNEEMGAFFAKTTQPIDVIVHSLAFAPATALENPIIDTKDDDFAQAALISAHSLAKIAQHAVGHMSQGGSIVALTYLGSQRVCANYRVMGVAKAALEAYVRELAFELGPKKIRVNAVSAGPIKTLAASGIKDFDLILDYNRAVAPLRENVTQDDVAGAAAFLASDESKMITGQTIFVDAGYSIVGVPSLS